MAKITARDIVELAVWISDSDDQRMIKSWKKIDAPRLFKESAEAAGVRLGSIKFYELKPGEDRAGTPPKDIQGINVRLLIAECDVIGIIPQPEPESAFTLDLELVDLERMRTATRRAYGLVWAADGKTLRELRDDECDRIINLLGPDAAARETMNVTIH